MTFDVESNCQDMNSLTGRGGANVEHASALNGPELTRTALNCTAAACAKSVSQVSAFAGPDWQLKGQVLRRQSPITVLTCANSEVHDPIRWSADVRWSKGNRSFGTAGP
jgi:hypothetical protein